MNGVGVSREAGHKRGHSRLDRHASQISLGSQFHHSRPVGERAGPHLGSGQVHRHLAGPVDVGGGLAHVEGHSFPYGRVVVGAVDAGDVHPCSDEVANQGVVVGGLGRKGHHDARHPARGAGTEEGVGVVVEGGAALLEGQRGRSEDGRPIFQPGPHCFDGGQHVSLAAPQGGETPLGQPALEVTDVALAQRQVMDEVDRVGLMDRGYRGDGVGMGAFHLPHEVFQAGQFSADGRQIQIAGCVFGCRHRRDRTTIGALRKGQRMVVFGRCLRREETSLGGSSSEAPCHLVGPI